MKKIYSINNFDFVNDKNQPHRIGLYARNFHVLRTYWFNGRQHKINGKWGYVTISGVEENYGYRLYGNIKIKLNIGKLVL